MTPPDENPAPPRTESRMLDPFAVGRSILGKATAVPVPEVVGYSALRLFAQGGGGQIWKAIREADSRDVALKVPLQSDAGLQDRLIAEGQTLRELRHPHIVQLIEITATRDHTPVLVMEFMPGGSISSRLPDGGFPFGEALTLFLPILEAVGHAHRQGIIHRDIKPSNILLTADGIPKVSDFGLAVPLKDRLVAFSLTSSGAVAGTVEYLAPECYLPGNEPSASADIFALGVLLYELLTGTPPRGSWAPLSQVRKLDVRLDELLRDAIHPSPGQRIACVEDFAARLEEIRNSRPRYAGTPLITPAIRVGDTFWTVLGLYLCGASFCATLSQTRTPVPALFDMTFGSPGLLVRGFLAVWGLSLGLGVLWLWQIFRLWRFRHIPLRESLPSPFGMRLGTGRLAAGLVGLTQFFCALLPPLFTLGVLGNSFHWLGPETPFWDEFLVVTPWTTDEPVSPWTWDPANFFDAGAYWLKEARNGFAPGDLRVADKTSFFIFGQPLIMTLCAAITAIGIAMTLLAWGRSWWPGRRRALLGVLPAASCGALWVGDSVWRALDVSDRLASMGDETVATFARCHKDSALQFDRADRVFAWWFLHQLPDSGPPPPLEEVFLAPSMWLDWCAPLTQAEVHEILERDRVQALAEHREIQRLWRGGGLAEGIHLSRTYFFQSFTESTNGQGTAESVRLIWRGPTPDEGAPALFDWFDRSTIPIYTAKKQPLQLSEVTAFFTEWCRACTANDTPALTSMINPALVPLEDPDYEYVRSRYQPDHADAFLAVLQAERERWGELTYTLESTGPPSEPLSGARWQVQPTIRQQGRRPGAANPTAPATFSWIFHLAFIEGRWRIVGLRTG